MGGDFCPAAASVYVPGLTIVVFGIRINLSGHRFRPFSGVESMPKKSFSAINIKIHPRIDT